MKKQNYSSFTILTLLFLFSAVLALPSSWPYFRPNFGQTSIIVPDQIDTSWQANLGDSVYIFPTTSLVTGRINGNEAIFVPTSCGVFALDAADGHTIWTYATTDSLKYAPLYLDSAHLYVSIGDSLIGLDPQTGQRIWSSSLTSQGFHAVPLSSGKIGVISTSGKLFVFDLVHSDSSWQIGPLPGGGCDNIAPVWDSQGYIYVVTLGTMLSDFNLCKVSPNGDLVYSPDYLFYEPGGIRSSLP